MSNVLTPLRGKASGLNVKGVTAGKLLVAGFLGWLLYVAHAAFVPIALALLLALVLSGPVEALYRRGVPRSLSAFFMLAIALGIVGGLIALLWKPAQYWYSEAPRSISTLKREFEPAARIISRVNAIEVSAGSIGSMPPRTSPRAPGSAVAAPLSADAGASLLGSSLGAAVSNCTIVILTLFLLTGGPPMMARMTAAFVDDLNAARVITIIEAVRGEVGRFYAATALINVALGIVTTIAMMLWGMPTPYVWGIMAALLNFIPYAGPTATLILLSFVAAITFDAAPRMLGVAGTYLAIATVEGQIVQPLFVGRRLQINPLLIFMGLWLGGLFWGIAGVLLSTPALVGLKVIAEHAIGGKAVLEFLGPNNPVRAEQEPLASLVEVLGERGQGDRRQA